MMRKWVSIMLALAMLMIFSVGCAGVQKDAKIKCPKCGAVFTVQEGLEQLQRMPGGAP
jgi:outer membrane lipoprotein-sorting protein